MKNILLAVSLVFVIVAQSVFAEKTKRSLRIISPNGKERGKQAWVAAVSNDISWKYIGSPNKDLVLEYSATGNNGPWNKIVSGQFPVNSDGIATYKWNVPCIDGVANCLVRVRELGDSNVEDTSDAHFEITQKFKVTCPNNGEYWYIGDTNVIKWSSNYDHIKGSKAFKIISPEDAELLSIGAANKLTWASAAESNGSSQVFEIIKPESDENWYIGDTNLLQRKSKVNTIIK